MFTVTIAIMLPFLAAVLIPIFNKRISRLHIGWFVLAVPVILFIILARYIPSIARGDTYMKTIDWIPSYGINFTTYLDGLSMIFGLLITGVGSLVILYSIYYLSARESLHHFILTYYYSWEQCSESYSQIILWYCMFSGN